MMTGARRRAVVVVGWLAFGTAMRAPSFYRRWELQRTVVRQLARPLEQEQQQKLEQQQQQQQFSASSSSPSPSLSSSSSSVPPTSEDEEWMTRRRKSFNQQVAMNLFGRHIQFLCGPDFSPQQQLYILPFSGIARLRDLNIRANVVNTLFNPLAEDATLPLQLVSVECDRVKIEWKSLFTLSREPLDIRIPRVKLVLDAALAPPKPATARKIRNDWVSIAGVPKVHTEYPRIEGAKFHVDELACYVRHLETPFPGCRNATVRVVLRDIEAVSVDSDGEAKDLASCWFSFNSNLAQRERARWRLLKRPFLVIAKRIVGSDLEIDLAPTNPDPATNLTSVVRFANAPRAAAHLTVGYDGPDVNSLHFDIYGDQVLFDLPSPAFKPGFGTTKYPPFGQHAPAAAANALASKPPGADARDAASKAEPQRALVLASSSNGAAAAPPQQPADNSTLSFRFCFGGPGQDRREPIEDIYEGSFRTVSIRRITQFTNNLVRPILALTFFLWSMQVI